MTIAVDIDDTITETSKKVSEYLSSYNPTCQTYHALDKIHYDDFLSKYLLTIQTEVEVKPNASKFLWKLHSEGHKIIIITYRYNEYGLDIESNTKKYLKENSIYYDEIYFNATKKGIIAYEHKVDYMIDDKLNNLDSCASYGIKGIKFGGINSSKYPTLKTWEEVYNYLERDFGNGKNN